MEKPVYITTTLPYVNSDPHIGFAGEIIKADLTARIYKKLGHQVFLNTGTDEHGQKIYEKAIEKGQEVKEYVDGYAESFKKLIPILGISASINFIRTTDRKHILGATEFWRLCQKDISKRFYKAKYCVGCELEKTDSELNEKGECPLHPNKEIKLVEEENYFFAFSKYKEDLLKKLKNKEIRVYPEFRHNEMIAFVEKGLYDFSVSRLFSKMPWGIPVPDDKDHVMYVWFDALVNYISTLDWPSDEEGNFKKFWKNGLKIQFAGKDNLRQQSLMWQAMLLSANISNTDKIYIGGFVNGEGNVKMSKSLGNVISPFDAFLWFKESAKYPEDVLRYYLIRHIHPFDDSPVSEKSIKEAYTANLVKRLGNVFSRVLSLLEKKELANPDLIAEYLECFENDFKQKKDNILWNAAHFWTAFDEFRFDLAIDEIFKLIQSVDLSVTKDEPFKINEKKELISLFWDKEKGYIPKLALIAVLLEPFVPMSSLELKQNLLSGKRSDTNLFNWLPK